jgi:hypothetical protein
MEIIQQDYNEEVKKIQNKCPHETDFKVPAIKTYTVDIGYGESWQIKECMICHKKFQ